MDEVKIEEKTGLRLKGELFIKLGAENREECLNNPDRHYKNIIVNICSNLIASWACMGNTMGVPLPSVDSWGIRTLAVGTGNWTDLQNPPAETSAQTQLFAELARKSFANVTYVDSISGLPSTDRTNIVDFTTTFLETEAVGPLVEMGLFGGSYHLNDGTGGNATATNGGTMINYKTFLVINKPATSKLTITWRLTF